MNKLTTLLRTSMMGLVPALLTFNVAATNVPVNDVMDISSTEGGGNTSGSSSADTYR
ncbi:hypothetical protein LPW36_03275 [Jinshanibacter sp. LJY008]|uniref:Uncharacterized protein n=1 Tax=Limnobaculum eriocheiris TaxID=2897391 RepID=A0A9X1SJ28_9GAMM|nr:hypothetical protein [Limnobaculum eriocheiris]MCD1125058.1 hypothetical protein [Limnobaculum eriocheiris]